MDGSFTIPIVVISKGCTCYRLGKVVKLEFHGVSTAHDTEDLFRVFYVMSVSLVIESIRQFATFKFSLCHCNFSQQIIVFSLCKILLIKYRFRVKVLGFL